MIRLKLCVLIVVLGFGLVAQACGGSGGAAEEAAAEPEAEASAPAPALPVENPLTGLGERPALVAPVRGIAEIDHTAPDTEIVQGEVVTNITIRNRSDGAIAGLLVEEFWYDADGNPLPSDSERVREPLMPGGIIQVELRVPRDRRMNRNNYKFSHANGEIRATLVEEIELPEEEEGESEGEPTTGD